MTILSFFLYMLGNFQKYLDTTLLLLLDLVLKFSYLTLGFGLSQFLFALPFRSSNKFPLAIVISQTFVILIALMLFLLSSFVFIILQPLEPGL